MRRLYRQHGKERLIVGFGTLACIAAGRTALSGAADVGAQMLDQQVAPGIGLVAGKPHRRLAVGAERVALVLVVGGVVAHPVVKAAAPLRGHVVVAVVGAVQVPLADVGGVVARSVEGVRHGGHLRRQRTAVGHHAALMRVAPGQQRAAERRAPRRPGHRAVEAHPLARQIVDVGREYVAVAPVAGGVGAMLVAEDPHHVGPPRVVQRQPLTHAAHPATHRGHWCGAGCKLLCGLQYAGDRTVEG